MIKKIESIKGNVFEAYVAEDNEVSVLNPGYLIDKDGNFISVMNGQDHSTFFSELLQKYGDLEFAYLDNLKAARAFVELECVVYQGMRIQDVTAAGSGNAMEGYGILFVPEDLEVLTNEQKDAIKLLLDTNKSLFGNYNRIELQIAKGINFKKISEEELVAKISSKVKN